MKINEKKRNTTCRNIFLIQPFSYAHDILCDAPPKPYHPNYIMKFNSKTKFISVLNVSGKATTQARIKIILASWNFVWKIQIEIFFKILSRKCKSEQLTKSKNISKQLVIDEKNVQITRYRKKWSEFFRKYCVTINLLFYDCLKVKLFKSA